MTPLIKHIEAFAALCLAMTMTIGANAQTSPYAGEQQRAIKALDAGQVAALRQGQGLGYAKAAELNGYPGPMHALELAEPLQLSTEQRAATQRLLAEHKARARELGEAVVRAEAALDRLFAAREATPEGVREATQRVASLQAQLRAEHLNTHLAQTALMSPAQAVRYAELRGYGADTVGAPAGPGPGPGHKHSH
jgi:hypothetical protein